MLYNIVNNTLLRLLVRACMAEESSKFECILRSLVYQLETLGTEKSPAGFKVKSGGKAKSPGSFATAYPPYCVGSNLSVRPHALLISVTEHAYPTTDDHQDI